MELLLPSPNSSYFWSQAAVLFVSNPRGAVPNPAVRAHRTAPPRAPSSAGKPAADGEMRGEIGHATKSALKSPNWL